MGNQLIRNNEYKSRQFNGSNRMAPAIPIEFLSDFSRSLPVKIQLRKFMNAPDANSEKPLMPALFQIAARADELQSLQSLPAVRNALALDRASRAEIMLNAEKLDAVLKAVTAKKKKSVAPRAAGGRFENRTSANDPSAPRQPGDQPRQDFQY
jgi:hypothetical protein